MSVSAPTTAAVRLHRDSRTDFHLQEKVPFKFVFFFHSLGATWRVKDRGSFKLLGTVRVPTYVLYYTGYCIFITWATICLLCFNKVFSCKWKKNCNLIYKSIPISLFFFFRQVLHSRYHWSRFKRKLKRRKRRKNRLKAYKRIHIQTYIHIFLYINDQNRF